MLNVWIDFFIYHSLSLSWRRHSLRPCFDVLMPWCLDEWREKEDEPAVHLWLMTDVWWDYWCLDISGKVYNSPGKINEVAKVGQSLSSFFLLRMNDELLFSLILESEQDTSMEQWNILDHLREAFTCSWILVGGTNSTLLKIVTRSSTPTLIFQSVQKVPGSVLVSALQKATPR